MRAVLTPAFGQDKAVGSLCLYLLNLVSYRGLVGGAEMARDEETFIIDISESEGPSA